MRLISQAQARRIAEEFLDSKVRERFSFDVVIIDHLVKDLGDAWLFPYDGRAYVESDDWRQMMAGNTPIAVHKITAVADFAR